MSSCDCLVRYFKASQALIVRVIYGCHASIGVFLAAVAVDKRIACFQAFALVSLCEYYYTVKKNKHGDWKWLSTSVFVYLVWLTPQIVILQSHSRNIRDDNSTAALIPWVAFQSLIGGNHTFNSSFFSEIERYTQHKGLTAHTLLAQSMMVVLVLGRLLGPKGFATRSQLSQLMVSFYGMGCDMLEFFSQTSELSYDMDPDDKKSYMYLVMMCVWSLSLFQFSLNLTVMYSEKGKRRHGQPEDVRERRRPGRSRQGRRERRRSSCCFRRCYVSRELISILTSLLLQDGTYLAVRIYIVVEHFDDLNIFSNLLFYTCKNIVLICILVYRLIALLEEAITPRSWRQKSRNRETDL